MSQLRGMPAEKAFDPSSKVAPGDKAPSREDVQGGGVSSQWRWPQRAIRRQPIDVGRILTKAEHQQRRARLRWDGKWRGKPWKKHHSDYYFDALQDACESVGRRSGRLLSDEAREIHINRNNGELTGHASENVVEASSENVGVFTELFSIIGMRSYSTLTKAHYQPGGPSPVSQKEIANFAQTARHLRAELWERAPRLKSRKRYRASPLPLALAAWPMAA